jgi:uncharacterized protein YceK
MRSKDHTKMRKRMFELGVLALFLPGVGCGTIHSYAGGCPGIYSGVRSDVDLIQSYVSPDPVPSRIPLGIDAPLANAWDTVFVALDVPASAALDTLGLPLAWALGPREPIPQGLGCGWSEGLELAARD